MQHIILTLTLGLFVTNFSLQAQSATTQISTLFADVLEDNPIVSDDNWSFYQDKEKHIFLIDFETLNYNIFEIVLRDKKTKKILFREDVFDLPVNSIYEFDYTYYAKGSYIIELRSFVRTIGHNVEFH